ncbi:MAG: hypothetical protein QW584_01000 [Thermofilaceae archaeon]
MSRGVGDIIAVLMIVSATIAAVIFATLVITSFMRQSEPKSAILSIQGVRAISLAYDYSRLLVEVVTTVHGTGAVNYTGSAAYDPNGNQLTCTLNSPRVNTVFTPGQTVTITMTCTGSGGQWAYRQITVEVNYIDVGTGSRRSSRGSGVIFPYS